MSSEAHKSKIEIKKVQDFFTFLPKTALIGFFFVCFISYSLMNLIANSYILIWLGSAIFIFLFSVISLIFFKRTESLNSSNKTKWQLVIVLNSLLNGLYWGLGCTLFYSIIDTSLQPYILLALVIILSSYFPVLVHYYLSFIIFALSLILPMSYLLLASISVESDYLASVLLLYLGLKLAFAHWFNQREFERFRLQTELYEQNNKVKEANDSKSQFLASASHDLRQPLQALGFYIVMLSDFLREPRKKIIFDKTLKAYQALEDLLNQLLNISKLNANLVDIVKTHFSVHDLFEKLKNDFELRAMARGLSIEFQTDDYYVYSDAVSVERILRNLLENSLRYTKQGEIKAYCHNLEDSIVFEVSDTGIGIDKQHINKIFDEFYQVKNPERDRSKGFGLGLYAVDRLARLLDSRINVESEVGRGSKFSIALEKGEKPHTLKVRDRMVRLDDDILDDIIILLVDDDEVVLDSISRLFLSWGCQVLTANVYKDALNILIQEEITPEILVIDYRLPEHQTGVELVEELRLLAKKSIPAVILTGDTGEESLTHINRSGLDFMHKPADPMKLKEKLKRLLANKY